MSWAPWLRTHNVRSSPRDRLCQAKFRTLATSIAHRRKLGLGAPRGAVARRVVTLTMFLMVEFVTVLEERKLPPPAVLELA